MRVLFFILLFAIGVLHRAAAQDPDFTQFFNNPLYFNPALSGTAGGLNIRSNYRNFWRKMDKGFNTFDITIDSDEPFLSGGLGFIAFTGVEGNGIIKSGMLGLSYSYDLLVIPRRFDIQMGLQGAFVQKHFMTENLVFSNQLDPVYGVTSSSSFSYDGTDNVYYPDFATGVNFRFNVGRISRGAPFATVNSGFAMHHITRPNESFTGTTARLPIKYVVYSTAVMKIDYGFSKRLFLTPGFIFQQQEKFKLLVLGSNIMIKPVFVGIWFRNKGLELNGKGLSAVALNAGINLDLGKNTKLQVAYSYDINVSEYQNLMGDAHEISLRMQFDDFSFFDKNSGLSRKERRNKECYNKF